eukprot:SAG11_NODE_5157_length_1644_cov_1.820712_1_plen_91_part_10
MWLLPSTHTPLETSRREGSNGTKTLDPRTRNRNMLDTLERYCRNRPYGQAAHKPCRFRDFGEFVNTVLAQVAETQNLMHEPAVSRDAVGVQ